MLKSCFGLLVENHLKHPPIYEPLLWEDLETQGFVMDNYGICYYQGNMHIHGELSVCPTDTDT